jgi:hypothetical protein
MGAMEIFCTAEGISPREAFNEARKEAQYEHGHGGHTGTIAEKTSFVMINIPEGKDPIAYAEELIENDDKRIDDKWGPAGCICLGEKPGAVNTKEYLFFGFSSS